MFGTRLNSYRQFSSRLTQDYIGGSSLLWRHQHVLMHHVETNYEDVDPDRGMQPVATLQPNETPKPAHTHQWWYIWILLVTLPAKWALGLPIVLL